MTTLNTTHTSGEETFLTRANVLMCQASEHASQPGGQQKAVEEFTSSRKLFEALLANPATSPATKEWCHTAIDEVTAHILHLETNPLEEEAPPATEPENGVVYRVACSLELVSCFSLSRDHVSTTVTDGTEEPIRLYVMNDQPKGDTPLEDSAPRAFLQITSDAAYPLGSNVPVLKAQSGYYVFLRENGEYYGIVFPQGYPEEAIQKFEQELVANCLLCVEDEDGNIKPVPEEKLSEDVLQVVQMPADAPAPTSQNFIASSITTGAEYVTWGISSASNFLRSGIERTGNVVSSTISRPDANTQVPAFVGAPVSFVKSITPGAVYISGAAASGLAALAGDIGALVAKGVGAIIPSSHDGGAPSGVVAVGKASIGAVVGIWGELTNVGKNLIEGTQQATVQVVKARYGQQMGSLAGDVIGIGKDVYMTNKNINGIAITSLAKGSVKAAGTSFAKKLADSPPASSVALSKASAAAKKSSVARPVLPSSAKKTAAIEGPKIDQ